MSLLLSWRQENCIFELSCRIRMISKDQVRLSQIVISRKWLLWELRRQYLELIFASWIRYIWMRLNLTEAERLRLRNKAARRWAERLERRLQQQAVPNQNTMTTKKKLSKWSTTGLDIADAGFSKLQLKESKYEDDKQKSWTRKVSKVRRKLNSKSKQDLSSNRIHSQQWN